MKFIKNRITIYMVVLLSITTYSCETDFVNPNAPTDAIVLTTRDGLLNLGLGIKMLYSTDGLRFMIENNAITTREAAITTTFINMIELEQGEQNLTDFNSNVEGLWASMMRVMASSEDLMEAAPNVELDSITRSNLIAHGAFFKALAIGALAQNYSQVVIETSRNNDAEFVTTELAYSKAIELLGIAKENIAGGISDEFNNAVLQNNIELANSIDAYLARYHLFAGNYSEAIASAGAVNLSSASSFNYDQFNRNPVWFRVFLNNAPNYRPRDNFGLPESFNVDQADGRFEFYLDSDSAFNINGLPIENLLGFFTTDSDPIPVYLPGEMLLIIAEANVRKSEPNLAAAVTAINAVRTKSEDPFGVNADRGEYSGPVTAEDLLDEIYMNRRMELFLTGVSLVDSRRFDRSVSTAPEQFATERNRNFYPFPLRERNNNPNTPANPAL